MKANGQVLVHLRTLISNDEAWGNDLGREVYGRLLNFVDSHPGRHVFGISLDGVRKTDASFPRESVIELAKRFRGEKGFYLLDFQNPDLKFNWEVAAEKRDQPMFLWDGVRYEILGPKPKEAAAEILTFVVVRGITTASEIAKRLRQPVNNVSNKLKQLVDNGYLLRKEQAADTGGIEYAYYAIH